MSTKESNQVSSKPSIDKEAGMIHKQQSINRVSGNKKATESCERRGTNQLSCFHSTKNENKINKRNCITKVAGKKRSGGVCGIRLPKRSELSPVRFFEHLSRNMDRGRLCFACFKKRHSAAVSASVSSSGRSKPSVIPVESHRSEAIEDCIEFINSSSSLPRSNSVSTNVS